jgi:hypothetical protein
MMKKRKGSVTKGSARSSNVMALRKKRRRR